MAEAFRSGAWRVLALDTSTGLGDTADEPPALLWDLHPGTCSAPATASW
ncbi:hypothetical protein HHL19_19835 [Streptomyces sp. R302]|nr:hypothetical protein [Streptomyces sp. R301]NML80856.1 hypothetical protein [Streptomyces sp. R302]